ncbi:NCS2 family permease [Aneurinibacillus sp. REN35]|uniref:NCS2 family permease n=1 Tax=Aneurinibacillus sp. REN35 TaxID=3237286 RepID=UPI0035298E4F
MSIHPPLQEADQALETEEDVLAPPNAAVKRGWLENFFRLSERNTTPKTEFIAGMTTFMTMSYIIFVNPLILSDAGIPKEAAVAATIFSCIFGTLMYALMANMPVAVGPGMGLNAFFTYTVVLGMGLTWQTGLGAVFISGVVFLILTITGVRKKIIAAVPQSLRSAIGVGVGLFIALIGLKNAGLVISSKDTIVSLGNLHSPGVLIALTGLMLTALLIARGVKGALVISIIATTVLSMIVGASQAPASISNIISFSMPSVADTFLHMDIKAALAYGIVSVIFSFTIVELFDNSATLLGLANKAGLVDKNGEIPNLNRAFVADAFATMGSATLGTTAMNVYVENATGISEGGKTGLTALVVAGFFMLALLFTPLVTLIPGFATAPVLILVGVFMFNEIRHIPFDDFTELVPAFLTIIMMPLTFSITQGLAFGFISYSLLKVLTGRHHEVTWTVHFISLAFIINMIYRV